MHGMQLPAELMTSTWQGSAIIHQHHDASFFTSSVGLSCFLYLPVAQVAALSWVLEASEYQAALRVGVPKLPVRLGIGGVSVDLTRSIRKELPQNQAPGFSCCIHDVRQNVERKEIHEIEKKNEKPPTTYSIITWRLVSL